MLFEQGSLVEGLARAQHEIWLSEMVRNGWKPGIETDEKKKVHAWLFGWDRIPADVKDEYRERVRLIPAIVSRAGFALVFDAGASMQHTKRKEGGNGS